MIISKCGGKSLLWLLYCFLLNSDLNDYVLGNTAFHPAETSPGLQEFIKICLPLRTLYSPLWYAPAFYTFMFRPAKLRAHPLKNSRHFFWLHCVTKSFYFFSSMVYIHSLFWNFLLVFLKMSSFLNYDCLMVIAISANSLNQEASRINNISLTSHRKKIWFFSYLIFFFKEVFLIILQSWGADFDVYITKLVVMYFLIFLCFGGTILRWINKIYTYIDCVVWSWVLTLFLLFNPDSPSETFLCGCCSERDYL